MLGVGAWSAAWTGHMQAHGTVTLEAPSEWRRSRQGIENRYAMPMSAVPDFAVVVCQW
jgi:hypothetical protein